MQTLIQRRPRPTDDQLWTRMNNTTQIVSAGKGACQASAAKLYNLLPGWGFVEGKAAITGVLLMWRAGARGDPWNHTAISVHWDEGDFIVDGTISQFGLPEKIFIGPEAEWLATIQSGEAAQVRGFRGLEVSRKAGGVYGAQDMDVALREFGERFNAIEGQFNATATPVGRPNE